MCTALPCCPQNMPSQLATQLQSLGRLLLANGSDEVLADQRPGLATRLSSLKQHIQRLVQLRFHVAPSCALVLTEQLVAVLLRNECCRRSLRRTVPLELALGPAALVA